MPNLTRREILKATSMAALAMAVPAEVFAADNCSVKTRYGTFNGFIDEQGVKTWLGIPYAQPPVKNLRWKAPQSLKPSNKTFDAKKFGYRAVQIDDGDEGSSTNPQGEDCLTLNIWKHSDKKNLPVMFFIHGGSFEPLYNGKQKYKSQTAEEIYQAWLKNRPDTLENFEDFANQLDWRVGQELTAEYQSKFADVYFYLFSEQLPAKKLRSCHAVDLPYTFNVGDHIVPNPAPNLAKQIQASWAAFAATGNPNNEFILHWEKYTAANRQTMELNSIDCACHKDLNTQNLTALRYVYKD